MSFNRAGVMAALVGGLCGAVGLQPAHAPTRESVAGTAPDPGPLSSLPQTLVSPADYLSALELRQPAVAGSIRDVQEYLRAEMEAAWSELEGTLVFMPYRKDGAYLDNSHEFAEQVVEQYQRSALGRQLSADNSLDHDHIENTIRYQAHALYRHEVGEKRWENSLGYHQEARVLVPVGRGEYSYAFGIIGLMDDCSSCKQVKPLPAGTQCLETHPDTAFHDRVRRLNVAFHELAHHISEQKKMSGHRYAGDVEQHGEETRADLFGTLMEMRLFGPAHALQLQLISDRNAASDNAHRYFNPRTFRSAVTWLQGAEPDVLMSFNLQSIFTLADSLSQLGAMNAGEIDQFKAHKAHDEKKKETPSERVQAYHKLLAKGTAPDSITVKGNKLPYSEIAYQYDLARLRNAAAGGNPYNNQLAQHNPLRAIALRGNQFGQVDKANPAQVAAINAFNRQIFGSRACQL